MRISCNISQVGEEPNEDAERPGGLIQCGKQGITEILLEGIVGEMDQWLGTLPFFQGLEFSSKMPILSGLQLLVTPAPRYPMPSSGLHKCVAMCVHTYGCAHAQVIIKRNR